MTDLMTDTRSELSLGLVYESPGELKEISYNERRCIKIYIFKLDN